MIITAQIFVTCRCGSSSCSWWHRRGCPRLGLACQPWHLGSLMDILDNCQISLPMPHFVKDPTTKIVHLDKFISFGDGILRALEVARPHLGDSLHSCPKPIGNSEINHLKAFKVVFSSCSTTFHWGANIIWDLEISQTCWSTDSCTVNCNDPNPFIKDLNHSEVYKTTWSIKNSVGSELPKTPSALFPP